MSSLCLYFQMHQPFRLRRYSVFDSDARYFDDKLNRDLVRRIARKCYLPATALLLDLARQFEGRFRISLSITGSLVEQLQTEAPGVLDNLRRLSETGCVEFLGETYYHSLAFLFSRGEFDQQVHKHRSLMQSLFGQTPSVFRNTELIYSNALADHLAADGSWRGILCEGVDRILAGRSPSVLYHPPGHPDLALLLKNYRLSDDIAFRFSNRQWSGWPITAAKFEASLPRGPGDRVCNLFMDFETFGEHQWEETGIFKFLAALPDEILERGRHDFRTTSECIAAHRPADVYDVPHMTSWADTERDISAWLGNAMQSSAHHELYQLEAPIKASGDGDLLRAWRLLAGSDHFYYMCTKYFADGEVHKYFNPYESPYDSYINFMNVLDHMRTRVEQAQQG